MRGYPTAPQSLVLLLMLSMALECSAQVESNNQANRELLGVERQAFSQLTPGNQHLLDQAERAWSTFSAKHVLFLTRLCDEKILKPDMAMATVRADSYVHCDHLRAFFMNGGNEENDLQAADRYLGRVYERCRSYFNARDKELFRDVERAWINYRDLDAFAAATIWNNPGLQTSAKASTTKIRAQQIAALLRPEERVTLAQEPTGMERPSSNGAIESPKRNNLTPAEKQKHREEALGL